MLVLAFWLLLVAALGGASMAVLDIATPPLRIGHGALAALGLFCLLIGALAVGRPMVWTAFGLNTIGLAAGAIFFGLIWRESAPPRALVWGHGLINAAGVLVLAAAVFG